MERRLEDHLSGSCAQKVRGPDAEQMGTLLELVQGRELELVGVEAKAVGRGLGRVGKEMELKLEKGRWQEQEMALELAVELAEKWAEGLD